ncbi:fibronectin type III domain-containing protein [Nonomuraea bangladeshensis]|uniref:fibronectin type III domain-containing protein n=1 Tax=Nonomuraea bangladeshensis TaxID=404385 RepID=UPI003C30C36C
MTDRIAAEYQSDTAFEHEITFTPPTPGARLIFVTVSWGGVEILSDGNWVEDHTATSYNTVTIHSLIATGSETSIVVNSGEGPLQAVLYERDNARTRLYRVQGTSSSGQVTTSTAQVPAGAIGQAFGVVSGSASVQDGSWTQGLVPHKTFEFPVLDMYSAWAFGPLPAAGNRSYRVSNLPVDGLGTVLLVVAYGSTDSAPPTPPAMLRATNIQDTEITVEWDPATDDTGVAGYGVYRDGQKIGPDVTALAYTYTGLTMGQTYTLEVDAVDVAGKRSAKVGLSVKAESDILPPTVPGNLRLTEATHTSLAVAWDASADAVGVAGYGVYVNGARLGPDQAGVTCLVTRLARGTTYLIEVDATDAAGNRSARASLEATTLTGGDPSAPPGLTATAGQEQITLAWGAAEPGALPIARYEVLLDGALAASTTQLGYVLEELEPGAEHQVGVRAVDAGLARGPAAFVTVAVPAGDWVPVASPVYRLGGWVGNATDAHGVTWTVEDEDGWSSSAEAITLGAEADHADGGFDGAGRYGSRVITLSGTAVAGSRIDMLAAQERLTGVLSASGVGVLRVAEAHLTRQARVRLENTIEVTDRGSLAFDWILTVKAANPRRFARRPVYAEVTFEPAQTSGSTTIVMAGDYPTIPAHLVLYGPVADPVIRVEELGLEIVAKAGTVLPDARYALDIDLMTREVWAIVPPEVWPEPRPGRTALARFPSRVALAPGPNTIRLSGALVPGQEATSPRLVIEATDAWI